MVWRKLEKTVDGHIFVGEDIIFLIGRQGQA